MKGKEKTTFNTVKVSFNRYFPLTHPIFVIFTAVDAGKVRREKILQMDTEEVESRFQDYGAKLGANLIPFIVAEFLINLTRLSVALKTKLRYTYCLLSFHI